MFGQNQNQDLGAELFKTWTDERRQEEVLKLVQGFRAGLPVGILCKMVETIVGGQAEARTCLLELLTAEERQAAVAGEVGGMKPLLESYLI